MSKVVTVLTIMSVALLALVKNQDNQEINLSDSAKIGSNTSTSQNKNEERALISSEVASSIALNALQVTETGVELSHPNHQVIFESDGILFEPREGPDWKWQLTHIGTEEEPLKGLSTQSVRPENNDPRIVYYHYGNIVEEYHAKQNTVEQRFVIEEPLSLDGQDLVIKGHVESQGEFEELKTESEKSWTWSDASGQVKLGDVTVFDAEGQILMACMNVTAQSTEIIVDAQSLASATYPVTVDPEIGANDFQISEIGSVFDVDADSVNSAVAYNSTNNEYLVVWEGRDNTADWFEIYGQRIDASSGLKVGMSSFRISDMGPGGLSFEARNPAVVYNPTEDEYFVVWHGSDTDFQSIGLEIYGQRLDAATGFEVGANDFRISDMGSDELTGTFEALDPAVAYNSTDNKYLVVWMGDDNTGTLTDDDREIFGQLIDGSTGSQVGANDFRISDMGPDGHVHFRANEPAVAYNFTNNEFLVVWHGSDDTAPLVLLEEEVFGQRINGSTGAEVGSNDFRISDMGPSGNVFFGATHPDVTYNPTENEYLVVWSGDDNTGALIEGETEIFGQFLDASTGSEIGVNDFRMSDMGPDGSSSFTAHSPAVTYNSADEEYLVVWHGEDDTGSLVSGETEIFGQFLDASTGSEVGVNDFRMSDMGPDGSTTAGAFLPDVAYNSTNHEYLVSWEGNDNNDLTEFSKLFVYGQRLKFSDTLISDMDQLSLLAGGTLCLTLDFGSGCAGFPYLVLGTTSGTSPGFPIDGNVIPLNIDAYTLFTLNNPNSSILSLSFGLLDANGQATVKFTLSPGSDPSLAGTIVHHAAVAIDPLIIGGILKVTNAVSALFTP